MEHLYGLTVGFTEGYEDPALPQALVYSILMEPGCVPFCYCYWQQNIL